MTAPPRIPRPPSKDDLDRLSEEQAMIADEWAPQPAQQPGPKERDPNEDPDRS